MPKPSLFPPDPRPGSRKPRPTPEQLAKTVTDKRPSPVGQGRPRLHNAFLALRSPRLALASPLLGLRRSWRRRGGPQDVSAPTRALLAQGPTVIEGRLPGRPRKAGSAQAPQASALAGARVNTGDEWIGVPALCPVTPRLLDPESAARYLGVSTWTVRDLEAGGHLPRVRLPLPGGKDLRKLLYDRADLDRLIETSKDPR